VLDLSVTWQNPLGPIFHFSWRPFTVSSARFDPRAGRRLKLGYVLVLNSLLCHISGLLQVTLEKTASLEKREWSLSRASDSSSGLSDWLEPSFIMYYHSLWSPHRNTRQIQVIPNRNSGHSLGQQRNSRTDEIGKCWRSNPSRYVDRIARFRRQRPVSHFERCFAGNSNSCILQMLEDLHFDSVSRIKGIKYIFLGRRSMLGKGCKSGSQHDSQWHTMPHNQQG
jgi:hypothetical protein